MRNIASANDNMEDTRDNQITPKTVQSGGEMQRENSLDNITNVDVSVDQISAGHIVDNVNEKGNDADDLDLDDDADYANPARPTDLIAHKSKVIDIKPPRVPDKVKE